MHKIRKKQIYEFIAFIYDSDFKIFYSKTGLIQFTEFAKNVQIFGTDFNQIIKLRMRRYKLKLFLHFRPF